jgi:uncharacterized protein (TIGR03435 family)
MRSIARLAFSASLLLAVPARAQTPAQPPAQTTPAKPAFEVASIKPSPPLDRAKIMAQMQAGQMPKFGVHIDAAQAEYSYMTLKDLIANAYKVKIYQVSGPDWLATERFDIVAKLPDGASKDDAPLMLQSLLEDRFKLAAHRDTQEHPVLGLIVAKGGPKLKEATSIPEPFDEDAPLKPGEMRIDTPDGPARMTRNPDGTSTINMGALGTFTQRIDGQTQTLDLETSSITMEGFADMLTNVLLMGGSTSRQVVDMTGIKGSYQAAIDISLMELMTNLRAQGMDIPGPPPGAGGAAAGDPSEPSGGTTVFASVEKLGLKLEPRKASILQLVVDHVEKAPTEN